MFASIVDKSILSPLLKSVMTSRVVELAPSSLKALKSNLSFPVPPVSESAPIPPIRISLPAAPDNLSAPEPPVNILADELPVRVSA